LTRPDAAPTKHAVDDEEPSGRIVALEAVGAVTPPLCACCGGSPSTTRREERGARSLIVPYCGPCLRHVSARTTRNLAATVSSVLLAGALSFALPIARGSFSLSVDVAIVLLSASLPIVIRFALGARAKPNHVSAERAVWWSKEGELACKNPRWASELARANEAESRPASLSEPRLDVWLALGPLSALVLGPAAWYLHHPLVRVLDLNETRIELLVDGQRVAEVEPTSAESSAAGIDVRIPAGEHEVSAVGPAGNTIHTARVRVQSGRRHLYVPGGDRYCFWLEEARYGRAGRQEAAVEPLAGTTRFWVLPRRVDTWFAPNPSPPADQVSSGGVLLALRQAPCSEAPQVGRP
jgi:hypothetical protein